jgi:hypothetical protein
MICILRPCECRRNKNKLQQAPAAAAYVSIVAHTLTHTHTQPEYDDNDDLLQSPLHTLTQKYTKNLYMNFPIFSKFTKKKFTKLTWGTLTGGGYSLPLAHPRP